MNAPQVGDKIRLTHPDEVSLKCGYKPGDEAIISAIVGHDDGVGADGMLMVEVKWTKGQEHDPTMDYDEVFYANEFEVIS